MRSGWAYAFLTGLFIGGYSNFFSKVVISGLVLYIVHPENFDPRRFKPLYLQIYEHSYPYISKIYSFSNSASPLFISSNEHVNSSLNSLQQSSLNSLSQSSLNSLNSLSQSPITKLPTLKIQNENKK